VPVMLSFLAPVAKSRHAAKPAAAAAPIAPVVMKKFQREEGARRQAVMCEDCDQLMYVSSLSGTGSVDQAYICSGCGRVEELCGSGYSGNSEEISSAISATRMDAMVDEAAAININSTTVRVSGPGANGLQRKLIASTSNYKRQQLKATTDQMENVVYQYNGPKIPANIVSAAANLYFHVQQFCIKRGDVRKGTMAACLYRKCIEANITRKPKEIADIFEISQSELSNGEKILDELYASECLRETGTKLFHFNEQDRIESFLARYFELFNLPIKYKEFSLRLIRFTEKYHLVSGSIVSSKCAGTIFLITNKLPELNVTSKDIVIGCRISKSTFARFASCIQQTLNSSDDHMIKVRSRLRRIFKKNGVPLP